jgi:hypothetical protein
MGKLLRPNTHWRKMRADDVSFETVLAQAGGDLRKIKILQLPAN